MSPLFRVHTPTIDAVIQGAALDKPPLRGWWAFLMNDSDGLTGMVEAAFHPDAITFGGIRSGQLPDRCLTALHNIENDSNDEVVEPWFLHIPSLFFTAVFVKETIVPIIGTLHDLEELPAAAKRRIQAATRRPRRRRHSTKPTPTSS